MSVVDLARYEMQRPKGLAALCELVAERHARGEATVLLAGGTDWMVEQEMREPLGETDKLALVADVSHLEELRGIAVEGGVLRIGAAATYLELRRSELVRRWAPMLASMAKDVGAVQIQARGTLGGNLATASPAADGVAALAAFDATIVVRSAARGERKIPFAELQTGYKRTTRAPDEVIVAIEIALPPEGSPWVWRKVGTRQAQAISKVALAGVAVVDGGRASRIGLGVASVAPVTARMPSVRELALSCTLEEITADAIDRAVDADITPIDDVRSTGVYRAHVARALVRSFFSVLARL